VIIPLGGRGESVKGRGLFKNFHHERSMGVGVLRRRARGRWERSWIVAQSNSVSNTGWKGKGGEDRKEREKKKGVKNEFNYASDGRRKA